MASAPLPAPLRSLARALLSALGWRLRIVPPPGPRCVLIVYPHTSNWDFPVGYLAKLAAGLPVHFVGKHTLFRWPVAGLLRRMGGIPVNRHDARGFVQELAREMAARDRMWLALAPEGTRAHTDHWKSGFYRLALAAGAPVGLAFIDWKAKEIGLTEYVSLTGDEERDLERIRAFYAGKEGKRPGGASDIRFRRGR